MTRTAASPLGRHPRPNPVRKTRLTNGVRETLNPRLLAVRRQGDWLNPRGATFTRDKYIQPRPSSAAYDAMLLDSL